MGTGGIKPCAYTFGGDQFQLPEQNEQLAKFSYRFLIAIYIGALIATFSTPELRKDVECFGRDSCFPLAFGVLSLLMTTAIGRYTIEIILRYPNVYLIPFYSLEFSIFFSYCSCFPPGKKIVREKKTGKSRNIQNFRMYLCKHIHKYIYEILHPLNEI